VGLDVLSHDDQFLAMAQQHGESLVQVGGAEGAAAAVKGQG
jgi:hypothetical protein